MRGTRKTRSPEWSGRQAASRAAALLATGQRRAIWLLILAAASLALYGNTLRNGFVIDDNPQLQQNPLISSYRFIPKLFSSNVWEFVGKGAGNYYRPLPMVFHMGERYLFGFQNPWQWHLVAVLLHITAVFGAYLLIRALADQRLALWAALLFAFHPIHVEAVAWISALPELLSALTLFVAMRLYHTARTGVRPALNHRIAVGVFFAGLFCKETALVFPALLLAYEFFYRRESIRAICLGWRRYLPYLCALGIYVAVRVKVLGAFAPWSSQFTRRQALFSAPALLSKYILKVLLPTKLNFDYDFTVQSALDWKFAGSIALMVALVALMFWLRKTRPIVAFAMSWFFITISPVLDITHVSKIVFAERYLYIPSLGFCVLGGWLWLHWKEAMSQPMARAIAYPAMAIAVVFYSVQIVRRIPDWNSDISLYAKGAELFPQSAKAQANLGTAYYEAGQPDLAIAPLDRALSLDPGSYQAHLYTALVLSALGDNQQASEHLQLAEKLNTEGSPEWGLVGEAYANLKQWDRAIECYRKELEVEPQNSVVYTMLGEALQGSGRTQESIAAFRQAIQLQPGFLDASINLAITLAEDGNSDDAIGTLTSVLHNYPDVPHADAGWFNLGNIYANKGEWDAAASAYERALVLNPDLEAARQRLESVEAERAVQRQ
jgi:protein O-mannosyl-transferase